jgi:hypothetical protein
MLDRLSLKLDDIIAGLKTGDSGRTPLATEATKGSAQA